MGDVQMIHPEQLIPRIASRPVLTGLVENWDWVAFLVGAGAVLILGVVVTLVVRRVAERRLERELCERMELVRHSLEAANGTAPSSIRLDADALSRLAERLGREQ